MISELYYGKCPTFLADVVAPWNVDMSKIWTSFWQRFKWLIGDIWARCQVQALQLPAISTEAYARAVMWVRNTKLSRARY